jgi:tetratricopeptide (TPR) repeat protein
MSANSSKLDVIFVRHDEQEQPFHHLLLYWLRLSQANPAVPPAQDAQLPSPHHKIRNPIVLLFGESGLGKSTLLRHYHNLASDPLYHLRVASIIDWRTASEMDTRQFAALSSQEIDPLPYFNLLHRKLADALSRRSAATKKQLAAFAAYQQAVAEVRGAMEQVAQLLFQLQLDKAKYEPLGWLIEAKTGTQKLMHWCTERSWPACDEAQISKALARYIGEGTGIEKKHLTGLYEALQNNLSATELAAYLYPEQILARGLGHDLRSQAKKQPLLLFFDTYEYIAKGDSWLRQVMSAAGQRVGWVIAGQAGPWSSYEQAHIDSDNAQARYSYQEIVADGLLLSINFATSSAGVFSVKDIIYYFAQLYVQQPALKRISRADAKRIFDITQGHPQVVSNIASSYIYRPDLDSILKKAEHDMIELYFENTHNDEQERQKLYALAMLRRVNNASVVASMLCLNAPPDHVSYHRLLQQLHQRYQFVAIKQGQPLLHEKVRDTLRHWLVTEGSKTASFAVVAKRLVQVQQSCLHEFEQQHHYKSMRDYLEDDSWINTYLDYIEASFWSDAATGIWQALIFMLAAMLYRREIIYEIERLSAFFLPMIPASYQDLWQRLRQCLSAQGQRTTTARALLEGLTTLHHQLTQMATLPQPALSSGPGIDYERGLAYLTQHIHNDALHQELLLYTFQLRANLTREQLRGSDEQTRSSHARLISQLNSLAEQSVHSSFLDLCLTPDRFPTAFVRELEGALWWLQGKIHHEHNKDNISVMLNCYQEAWQRLGNHSALQEEFAYIYWEIAADHFNAQRYQQSIACLDQAVYIKYNYEDAYYSRGNALYEMGRYKEAIVQYQYAICLYKQYLPAFINLGNAYGNLKRYEDALVAYNEACTLDPQNYLLYYNRGCTYKELKKYHESLQDFTRTIELKEDYVEAYIGRGNTYGIMYDYTKARADYQKAAEIDPHAINNVWMAMWASFGKTVIGSEAQHQLEKLIQLDPQHYIASIGRAMCMALQHQKLHHIEPVLEQATLQESEQWDSYFWKGLIKAFYGQTTAARQHIDQALKLGLPPLLLMPLYWLEPVVPHFFNTYARPLLQMHALLEQDR